MTDQDGFVDLFANAPCGYAVTDRHGTVVRANREFLRLVDRPVEDVVGRRTLASLVSVGGRIYFETHLLPVLEHDGFVREIALDVVRPDGSRVPVLFNATLAAADHGFAMRAVLIETRDRRLYEEDLLHATREAERVGQVAADLAETLQQTLIPPAPPSIPHLEIAAAYRPAGNGREVGGDFYDVFQLAPDTWFVVLGDVSGKGILAATVTSLVRYAVRSLAVVHEDPAELLAHLDAAIRADPTERYCTAVVARLEFRDGRWDVRLSLGGHPAPLLRLPDGTVRALGTPGTPIGLVETPYFETVHHRLVDETLTLYTDGVTEARGADGLFGETRLTALVAALPHDPHAINEVITQAALDFQDGNASDDIAVVTFGATSSH